MASDIQIVLTSDPLDILAAESFVRDVKSGGEVVFVGRVRNHSKGKTVLKLEFEAMATMAEKEMRKIAEQALVQFDIDKVAIHHGLGTMGIGAIPVIIAVGSTHRKAAFQACEFCIDSLKQTVPIWKKEFFEGGEHWVSATP